MTYRLLTECDVMIIIYMMMTMMTMMTTMTTMTMMTRYPRDGRVEESLHDVPGVGHAVLHRHVVLLGGVGHLVQPVRPQLDVRQQGFRAGELLVQPVLTAATQIRTTAVFFTVHAI